MKDTYYFSHDYNARLDAKLKALIRKHGMLGYGVFWSIIEDLYNNANALRTDYESIAFDLRVKSDVIKSIVNDFELFAINGEYFGSLSVERRLKERLEKSNKARESALNRWLKDANALRTQSECNAIKERKEKKKKENRKIIPPSIDEFKNYFQENGYNISVAERAYKGYELNNWHDSRGAPVLNWKSKCQNVWFKNENKIITINQTTVAR